MAKSLSNKEIALAFSELAGLMELHDQNSFTVTSYKNAYRFLRKLGDPLSEMSKEELENIRGVGKAIAGKIQEMLETGTMALLDKWRGETPAGIQQMLKVKGFGPKKIGVIWRKMGIEDVGELLLACHENRLVDIKGFGAKSQTSLREQLEYFMQSKDSYHYATLVPLAQELLDKLYDLYPDERHELTGEIRRLCPVLDQVDLITTAESPYDFADGEEIQMVKEEDSYWELSTPAGLEIRLHLSEPEDFGTRWFQSTNPESFTQFCLEKGEGELEDLEVEEQVFESLKLPFVAPELRETDLASPGLSPGQKILDGSTLDLVEEKDVKGVVHAHSTYSDGLNSLIEMANRCRELGYSYLGITDHSKSAFYADGLVEERVEMQWREIDQLNQQFDDFVIFKGIESDILGDGSLDYEEDYLKGFDFIIASVHSNLKMDQEKATKRVLAAVENPYTTMLGHPTGRLLLSRKGYPLDHQKIIDACAANGVAIEINANPLRLDLDWQWIPYALEKGVKISVNPDAHSLGGIEDIKWGIAAARKGGLQALDCPCCLDAESFLSFCKSKQ
ncbi:MAG: DNA polymerase/3'-5' exonuclease PolX [Saprospiraceae bacterium]|nr:DNA polymerase/3'-5' exonuclease PolX [Saprospiraceae bacterium]